MNYLFLNNNNLNFEIMFPNVVFISDDEIEGGIKIYDYKSIKKQREH